MFVVLISPGRAVPVSAAARASGSTRPFTVVRPWTLGLLRCDAVGEGTALARRAVGVLMPGALGIKEPVEFLLVEGGALLGPIGDGYGVVRAALALTSLGGLGAVTVLAVPWRMITSWTSRVVVPLARTIKGVAAVLVVAVCMLGVLHVGVLVDNGHHVGDGLGIAFKHLPP